MWGDLCEANFIIAPLARVLAKTVRRAASEESLRGLKRKWQAVHFGHKCSCRLLGGYSQTLYRKPSVVDIICFFTQQVKELSIDDADKEVKSTVRIRHDKEKNCFPVSYLIQFKLVITHDLTKLCNIKWSKSGTAAHKNRFCGFACCYLSIVSCTFSCRSLENPLKI